MPLHAHMCAEASADVTNMPLRVREDGSSSILVVLLQEHTASVDRAFNSQRLHRLFFSVQPAMPTQCRRAMPLFRQPKTRGVRAQATCRIPDTLLAFGTLCANNPQRPCQSHFDDVPAIRACRILETRAMQVRLQRRTRPYGAVHRVAPPRPSSMHSTPRCTYLSCSNAVAVVNRSMVATRGLGHVGAGVDAVNLSISSCSGAISLLSMRP